MTYSLTAGQAQPCSLAEGARIFLQAGLLIAQGIDSGRLDVLRQSQGEGAYS